MAELRLLILLFITPLIGYTHTYKIIPGSDITKVDFAKIHSGRICIYSSGMFVPSETQKKS